MPTHDNSGKDEMSLGLLPQARFILTYVNLLASSSVKNPASVTQMINSGCLALCQTVLRLAGPDESEFRSGIGTKPDTWPPVADGWAGAEIAVFPLFNSSVTDGPTDRRTDKASYRVACPQLKIDGTGFGVRLKCCM